MSLPSWRCCRCFTRGAEEFMKDQNLSDPWIFTVFSVCFLSFCSTLFLNELLYLFLCIKFWNFHSYFFPNGFVLNEQQYVWIDKQAYHISYRDKYCLSNWWWQEYCSYSRVHGVRSRVHPELAASLSQRALTPATSVEGKLEYREKPPDTANMRTPRSWRGGVQPRICFMFNSNTDRKK